MDNSPHPSRPTPEMTQRENYSGTLQMPHQLKVIFFDFMGTLLNWHVNITAAFPERFSVEQRSSLAIALRKAFFDDINARFEAGLPPEDIDLTHARLLSQLLERESKFSSVSMQEQERLQVVRAWHAMTPWPDVSSALARLRSKFEVFVLANGTTRLQLDLCRSSGLQFDMLFSSQLLGQTKPDPRIYERAMELVSATSDQCLMVASHAYDLRAARSCNIRTVYIRRNTEDIHESMEKVKEDVDFYIEGIDGTALGGLAVLADLLGV